MIACFRTFMHASQMNWQSYFSGLWCILNTMTSVGYGDLAPATSFGRLISVLAGLWGVFLFSLMVVSLSNSTEFTKNQAKVIYLFCPSFIKVISDDFRHSKQPEKINALAC